jgi:hypothetical protein
MGTKSHESIYGSSVRALAERAKEARKVPTDLAAKRGSRPWPREIGPALPQLRRALDPMA